MRKKYKREMDYVYAIMNDLERKLERPIRDLDDVRTVMETLKKIREQEVDMELKIDPVEVSYHFTFKNIFQEIYIYYTYIILYLNIVRKSQRLVTKF